MRKIICILVVVVIFLFVVFNIPIYDLDTITEKFNECYNEIESIADKYNLESKCWVKDGSQLLREYYIIINDKSRVDIEFSTNATETKKGNGTFSISYTISDVSEDNNIDVGLFTEFVNSISGKTITTDFVTEFLTAPEEKYSVEKYGLSDDGYAVSIMHPLNFGEDWVIGYDLTYDNHAELWFYGRTK